MPEEYFLTCDIGTSVTKTVLYRNDFTAVSSLSRENHMINKKACWLEEDPEQWWRNIKEEINHTTQNIDTKKIIGIATCGQMHAPILVDKKGDTLFSCLSWPDGRTVTHVKKVSQETGFDQNYFTSTAPKLLWIKENHPEILEKTYKILLPKDFIRMKLSDTFCTDNVDAGGTGMYDQENKTWNWKIVDYLGLDHSQLPDVHPSEAIIGTTTEKTARDTNLVSGIPVITGTGDFGIGRRIERASLEEGNLLIYLGTGPGIWWVTGGELFGRRSRDSLCILGVAGTMPQWFKNRFFDDELLFAERGGNEFGYLDSKAEEISPGSEGLIVLPHLMGERSFGGRTFNMEGKLNPYARGVFYGLCMGHTKYHIYRAILEGIAYHLRLCWENIQKANNAKDSSLIVTSGGGAKSKIWRQILADVFNTRVGRLNELETSTLGLACLTSVALGRHKRFEDVASQVKNTVIDVIEPIPENHAVYSRYYEDYKDLELSLESFFKPKNM